MTLIPSLQPCLELPPVLRETRRVCVESVHKVCIPLINFCFIMQHSDNLGMQFVVLFFTVFMHLVCSSFWNICIIVQPIEFKATADMAAQCRDSDNLLNFSPRSSLPFGASLEVDRWTYSISWPINEMYHVNPMKVQKQHNHGWEQRNSPAIVVWDLNAGSFLIFSKTS